MYDLVIKNGEIVDPLEGIYISNIGIKNNKIKKITKENIKGKKIVNAKNKMISPGFIDIHMHEDKIENGKIEFDIFNNMALMGVTTSVGGNCGLENDSINNYFKTLENKPPIINYIGLIGHKFLREKAGCNDKYKKATNKEINKMKKTLKINLDKGACGLSFGLEYIPGTSIIEMIELSKVVSEYSNRIVSAHYRFDAARSLESIAEMIIISRETGVRFQVSHIGSCTAFGMMETSLNMIENANRDGVNIMADVYPYDAFSTYIGSAVFDEGCFERWGVGYKNIKVMEGKYKGEKCNKAIFEYLRKEEPDTLVVAFVMNEEEIIEAMKHPLVIIASDGILNKGQGHPRASGTFPKLLGKYVRDENQIDLVDAINKITWMPAKRLGLNCKGRIKENYDADICIFDYEDVIDKATYNKPTIKPEGINEVIVNGDLVVENGDLTCVRSGKVIKF